MVLAFWQESADQSVLLCLGNSSSTSSSFPQIFIIHIEEFIYVGLLVYSGVARTYSQVGHSNGRTCAPSKFCQTTLISGQNSSVRATLLNNLVHQPIRSVCYLRRSGLALVSLVLYGHPRGGPPLVGHLLDLVGPPVDTPLLVYWSS